MKIKKIGILTVSLLAVFSLSACGNKKKTSTSSSMPAINAKLPSDNVTSASQSESKAQLALDVYMQQLQPQIDKVKAQVTDNYSDIVIFEDGMHGITITYQMNKTYTIQDDTAQQIRDSFKSLNGSILSGMQQSGIQNPTLHFVVLNGDGSAVIDEMFTG